MPIDEQGVGALTYSSEERKKIAANSKSYQCPVCSHKLKDDEQTILANRTVAEEAHHREKQERLKSEMSLREHTSRKEEELKEYYMKKSMDESEVPEQLIRQISAPVPLFGASPKGVFGPGPNVPCIRPVQSSQEPANLGKRMQVSDHDEQSRVSSKSFNPRETGRGMPGLSATVNAPSTLNRAPAQLPPAPLGERNRAVREEEMTEEKPEEGDQVKDLIETRARNRALMEDFLARKDVASLEAILRSQIAQGTIRADEIMANQYQNFIDKINKVTYLHRDQVYDSLGGLLEEAIEMQTVSRSIEFHDNEAAREEAERERRRKLEEARAREMNEDKDEDDEEREAEITEEDRIKQSAEYQYLQKRQRFLDFMIYAMVFMSISYFAWDMIKLMFSL